MELVTVFSFLVFLFFAFAYSARRARYRKLMEKYQNKEIVEKLMDRMVWQGMSSELLFDSLGNPESQDEVVYKTKTKYVYKFGRTGKNRYRTRVFVENGYVVGWQIK